MLKDSLTEGSDTVVLVGLIGRPHFACRHFKGSLANCRFVSADTSSWRPYRNVIGEKQFKHIDDTLQVVDKQKENK